MRRRRRHYRRNPGLFRGSFSRRTQNIAGKAVAVGAGFIATEAVYNRIVARFIPVTSQWAEVAGRILTTIANSYLFSLVSKNRDHTSLFTIGGAMNVGVRVAGMAAERFGLNAPWLPAFPGYEAKPSMSSNEPTQALPAANQQGANMAQVARLSMVRTPATKWQQRW